MTTDIMHYKARSRITPQGEKVWVATFKNPFTASRFAEQQRQRGYQVFEPNPLISRDDTEIEYWK
ncbi:TPA: hypothetical protein NIE10_006585 [Pseudomonas aeruginosa]|nr:hypothetical protein [Pseudomonas aeruginosa]